MNRCNQVRQSTKHVNQQKSNVCYNVTIHNRQCKSKLTRQIMTVNCQSIHWRLHQSYSGLAVLNFTICNQTELLLWPTVVTLCQYLSSWLGSVILNCRHGSMSHAWHRRASFIGVITALYVDNLDMTSLVTACAFASQLSRLLQCHFLQSSRLTLGSLRLTHSRNTGSQPQTTLMQLLVSHAGVHCSSN